MISVPLPLLLLLSFFTGWKVGDFIADIRNGDDE